MRSCAIALNRLMFFLKCSDARRALHSPLRRQRQMCMRDLSPSGAMVTGPRWIDGKRYVFDRSGHLLT